MKRSRFISLLLAGMLGVTSILFPAEVFGSEPENEVIEVFEEDEESVDNATEEAASEEVVVSGDEVIDKDEDYDDEEWLDVELTEDGRVIPHFDRSEVPSHALKAEFTYSLKVEKEDGSTKELCWYKRNGIDNLGSARFHQRYFNTNGDVFAVIWWKEGNKTHFRESSRNWYEVPATRLASPQNIEVETDVDGTWLSWSSVANSNGYLVDIFAEGYGPDDMDHPYEVNSNYFDLGEFLDQYGYQKWIIEITANSADIYSMRCSEPARFVYDPDEGVTLTLDKEELNLATGKSETIKANFSGKPADKTVIWMSSDSSVASVDGWTGTVTAVSAGEAFIKAVTPSGKESTNCCKVTVFDQISSIKLDPSSKTLGTGEEFVLKADVGAYTVTNSTIIVTTGSPVVVTGPAVSFKPSNDYITVTQYGEGKVIVKAASDIGGESSVKSQVIVRTTDGSEKEAVCNVTINAKDQKDQFVPLKKLGLNAASITLNGGKDFKLSPVYTPSDASIEGGSLRYDYADEESKKYITVENNGYVTAKSLEGVSKAAAKVKVTVKDKTGNEKEAICTVTVVNSEVKVNKITWEQKKIAMGSNATMKLKYDIAPAWADNSDVKFLFSEEGIVEYYPNDAGSVWIVAKKPGTTKLTVTAQDGSNKSATCTITVGNPVESVKIVKGKFDGNLQVGKTVKLKAEVTSANGKPANSTVTWKTSDKAVASVDKNGKITAKSAGTVTITAYSEKTDEESDRKSDSIVIVVYVPVKKLAMDGKKTMSVYEGKEGELQPVIITPSDATYDQISWTSSDEEIVKLNQNLTDDGERLKFTALKPGKVKLTGLSTDVTSKKKITITVTVLGRMKEQDVKLNIKSVPRGVNVDNNNSKLITVSGLNAAKKQTLTLTPVLTAKAANKNVTFTSSNPNAVTVDKKGKTKAVGAGNSTIIMMTEDGNFIARCTVYTINKK